MWIEIIGLPGVGKTTLIEKNINLIKSNYEVIESKKASLLQKITTKIIYYLCYAPNIKGKKLSRKLAYRHGFRLFKSPGKPVFFYDSGLIQLLLESLIENNFNNKETILKILKKLPNDVYIIYIKDELESVVQREINRTKPRFNLSPQETQNRYAEAQNFIEKELFLHINIKDTINPNDDENFIKALHIEKTH